VFVQGDQDLAPIAYFHMVENWRPDLTLYHSKGLVLATGCFTPCAPTRNRRTQGARVHRERDPSRYVHAGDIHRLRAARPLALRGDGQIVARWQPVSIDIPDEALRFFEESVLNVRETNAGRRPLRGPCDGAMARFSAAPSTAASRWTRARAVTWRPSPRISTARSASPRA